LGLNTNDLYFIEDLNGYGNQSITQRFSYSYDNLLTNLGIGGKYNNGNVKIYGTFYVSREHLFKKADEIGKLITSSILYNGFYNTNLFFSVKHNISNYPNGVLLYSTKELREKIKTESHSRTSISLGLDKIFKKFKLHFLINNDFIHTNNANDLQNILSLQLGIILKNVINDGKLGFAIGNNPTINNIFSNGYNYEIWFEKYKKKIYLTDVIGGSTSFNSLGIIHKDTWG